VKIFITYLDHFGKSLIRPRMGDSPRHDTQPNDEGFPSKPGPPSGERRGQKNPSLVAPGDGAKTNSKTIGDYPMKVPHKQIDNNKKSQPENLLREENSGPLAAPTGLSAGSRIIASRIIHRLQLLIISDRTGEVK